MLIEFATSNFMSIKDEVRLSFAARPSRDRDQSHLIAPQLSGGPGSLRLTRSVAIYGPNGAGKTNVLLALSAMQEAVRKSFQSIDELPAIPFAFDPTCRLQPSVFEAIFVIDNVRYQYGFAATSKEVTEEWLFAWPHGRSQVWFQRSKEEIEFGPRLRGPKNTWKSATRSNALFLSVAVALNSKQLKPVSDWFLNRLNVAPLGAWDAALTTILCHHDTELDSVSKQDIVKFLDCCDPSIKDIRIEEEKFPVDRLPGDLPPALRNEIERTFAGKKRPQVHLLHTFEDSATVELNLGVESHGTQRIFSLAGPWLDALKNGDIIAIDELEDSLHPTLLRFLVDCFHNNQSNPNGAQLLFTTHNTSILSQEVFRRDQIWFCERNRKLETQLLPLTHFRPRKQFENLERSYLTGRYGAIPYLPSSRKTAEK